MTTRAQIRQAIMGVGFCNDGVLSTASAIGGAAGATLVDTKLQNKNDYWNGGEIVILSGAAINDVRAISTWVLSTGTFTPVTAFSAQIASAVQYEAHKMFPAAGAGTSGLGKNGAINEALKFAGDRWTRNIEDESIPIVANTYAYSLAAITAPAIDPTWLIDEVRYDPGGTGAGYDWIKVPKEFWRVRDLAGTLWLQFDRKFLPPAGQKLRLIYRARPAQLTADSGTGGVLLPNDDGLFYYVCFKATALLFSKKAQLREGGKADAWETRADKMNKEAEGYLTGERPQPKPGEILFPTWGSGTGRGAAPRFGE